MVRRDSRFRWFTVEMTADSMRIATQLKPAFEGDGLDGAGQWVGVLLTAGYWRLQRLHPLTGGDRGNDGSNSTRSIYQQFVHLLRAFALVMAGSVLDLNNPAPQCVYGACRVFFRRRIIAHDDLLCVFTVADEFESYVLQV